MKTVQLWQFIDPVGVWLKVGDVDIGDDQYATTLCIDVPSHDPDKSSPLQLIKYQRMQQAHNADIFVNYTNTFACKK